MGISGLTDLDPSLQAIAQLFFIGVDLIVILGFSIAFLRLRDRFAIFVLGALCYDVIKLVVILISIVRGEESPGLLLDALSYFRGLSILGAVQVVAGVSWNRKLIGIVSSVFALLAIGPVLLGNQNFSALASATISSLAHLSACVLLLRARLLDTPGTIALFMATLLSTVFFGCMIYAQGWGNPVSLVLYYLLHNVMNVFIWVSLGVIGLDRVGIWLNNARIAVDESEQRFLLVANASTDAILGMNRDGRIIDWNSYASESFGWAKRNALEMNVRDFLPDQTAENLANRQGQSPVRTSIAGTQTFDRFETMAIRKSGQRFPVEVTLVYLPKSGSYSLALIVRDITQRKEHEATLIEAKEELESLNERLETALSQATDMAAAANEANLAKSQFLATMSHEIRTPMNGIIGMTSLLSYTELKSEQKDFVETIRESCDVLLTIINEILDFSKIEAGQLQLEFQSFDLRRCVEGAFDLLGRNSVGKSVYLGYLFRDVPVTTIYSDETRLRQVLVNLLGNAIKFTEEGGVFVYVSGIECEGDETEITFSVVDSGIGIPGDKLDLLFQPFSQVDSSTARRFGGTGLGLAICSRLCELMGGKIWVESETGVGSRFSFTIRAKSLESVAPEYLESKQPALDGRYVLILEGNESSREILVSYCQQWQMNVTTCANIVDLEAYLGAGGKLDLLLLDFDLMSREGFDFVSGRERFHSLRSLPYIVVSGGFVASELESDRHCVGHLSRPIKPARFYSMVQGFFEADIAKKGSESDLWRFNDELASENPLRILLAEDNLVNQKVAVGFLHRMGYVADLAGNGLEVLDAVGRQEYDVILMDVQMPELGGLEATRRLVEDYSNETRPWIVAMTAGATAEDQARCMAAGMDDFLPKPINAEAFQEVIDRCPRLGERRR
ncbi:MAG: response regulator [Verrucomicrobia bacterium]|jgi:PAS domain S-box-containing protein|nr:response regulator [Verrucomicrobiota bacterium]